MLLPLFFIIFFVVFKGEEAVLVVLLVLLSLHAAGAAGHNLLANGNFNLLKNKKRSKTELKQAI